MRTLFLLFVPALLIGACTPKPSEDVIWVAPTPDQIDGQSALVRVENLLAMGLRDSGTEGGARAAEWLADELRQMGLQVEIDTFENLTPDGPIVFRNVVATLSGKSEKQVVLLSHYDTKINMPEGFQGANDSGSSTGLLLELASVYAKTSERPAGLVFAFVDGEECRHLYGSSDGLHGSRQLVRQLKDRGEAEHVVAAVVLDMIGDADLSMTVPRNSSPELVKRVFDAAREEGVRNRFRLYSSILDDHVPFLKAGIPAIDLIDFNFGSAPGLNDYWHTENDTLDKLSADNLEVVGRITLRAVNGVLNDAAL